jgi:hypothetical protein
MMPDETSRARTKCVESTKTVWTTQISPYVSWQEAQQFGRSQHFQVDNHTSSYISSLYA